MQQKYAGSSLQALRAETRKPYKPSNRDPLKASSWVWGPGLCDRGCLLVSAWLSWMRDMKRSLLGLLLISLAVRTSISSMFLICCLAGLAGFWDSISWHSNVTMKCLTTKEIFKQARQKFLSAARFTFTFGWPVCLVFSQLLCFPKWRSLPYWESSFLFKFWNF